MQLLTGSPPSKRGNILPHVQSYFLVRPSSPSCAVHAFILEWSLPILPHVQSHPNMHYPVLAHVRSLMTKFLRQSGGYFKGGLCYSTTGGTES